MDDYKENILNSLKELNLKEEIKLEDIPKLDLYMDQVITLFENELSETKRNETDKILTKTMINNYTKDKILMPAQNKKYSRNHIIMMILIYNLKQSLPINDIKFVLNKIVENFNDKDDESEKLNLESIYKIFLNIKDIESTNILQDLDNNIDNILTEISNSNKDDDYLASLLTVLMLVTKANLYKKLAETIIDTHLK